MLKFFPMDVASIIESGRVLGVDIMIMLMSLYKLSMGYYDMASRDHLVPEISHTQHILLNMLQNHPKFYLIPWTVSCLWLCWCQLCPPWFCWWPPPRRWWGGRSGTRRRRGARPAPACPGCPYPLCAPGYKQLTISTKCLFKYLTFTFVNSTSEAKLLCLLAGSMHTSRGVDTELSLMKSWIWKKCLLWIEFSVSA